MMTRSTLDQRCSTHSNAISGAFALKDRQWCADLSKDFIHTHSHFFLHPNAGAAHILPNRVVGKRPALLSIDVTDATSTDPFWKIRFCLQRELDDALSKIHEPCSAPEGCFDAEFPSGRFCHVMASVWYGQGEGQLNLASRIIRASSAKIFEDMRQLEATKLVKEVLRGGQYDCLDFHAIRLREIKGDVKKIDKSFKGTCLVCLQEGAHLVGQDCALDSAAFKRSEIGNLPAGEAKQDHPALRQG